MIGRATRSSARSECGAASFSKVREASRLAGEAKYAHWLAHRLRPRDDELNRWTRFPVQSEEIEREHFSTIFREFSYLSQILPPADNSQTSIVPPVSRASPWLGGARVVDLGVRFFLQIFILYWVFTPPAKSKYVSLLEISKCSDRQNGGSWGPRWRGRDLRLPGRDRPVDVPYHQHLLLQQRNLPPRIDF